VEAFVKIKSLLGGFYKNNEGFWKQFQRNRGFFLEIWAFIKISIIFDKFFREIAAFSRIVRLFKYIFSGIVE
jgi:hypothetical protein